MADPNPSDSQLHPVPLAPAPWTAKAESYWLFLTLGGKLPEGVYDRVDVRGGVEEVGYEGKERGEFKGGLGVVMIVRYTDTPVGPYDELLLIPGNFSVPTPTSASTTPPTFSLPRSALRITRIYVSTSNAATVYNGRRNWNIPKHHARFSFSAPQTLAGQSPPQEMTVKVYAPGSVEGDGAEPFFGVRLRPWRWVPAVPVKSKWLPVSTVHVQPPLAEGEKYAVTKGKVDGEVKEEDVLVGTEKWSTFEIGSAAPRARGCWVEVLEAGGRSVKAGKWWPQDVKPWGVGAWMEEGTMSIPMPNEWKL
ncbi:hypothetical protein B0J11DRAFT_421942 [Dendryphion nanum]|uniref:Uncharacterized protein n=1 Tax=Dendryphion nanum TaxID=256645 RepID=A0A9P9IWQ6_9PLEO|nr:hypothetical protein B0J11DRAFT_421942 [Dendryphion nanum]